MPKKTVAKRARSMPLTDKQAKAAIQALRDDAGKKKYRKKKSTKRITSRSLVWTSLAMKGATLPGIEGPPGRQRV